MGGWPYWSNNSSSNFIIRWWKWRYRKLRNSWSKYIYR